MVPRYDRHSLSESKRRRPMIVRLSLARAAWLLALLSVYETAVATEIDVPEAPVCEAGALGGNAQCINHLSRRQNQTKDKEGNDDEYAKLRDSAMSDSCRLYMVPSLPSSESASPVSPRLVSGVFVNQGDLLLPPTDQSLLSSDLHIRITDANKNEWSPWHDVLWSAANDMVPPSTSTPNAKGSPWLLQNDYQLDWYVSGISSLARCARGHGEEEEEDDDDDDEEDDEDDEAEAREKAKRRLRINAVPELLSLDSLNTPSSSSRSMVHRSQDATAGSFASEDNDYAPMFVFRAIKDIEVGEEIVVSCEISFEQDVQKEEPDHVRKNRLSEQAIETVLVQLEREGVCMDSLAVKPSTMTEVKVGRGAFTKHRVATGQTIARTPVIPLDKSQLEISQQAFYGDHATQQFMKLYSTRRSHDIMYQSHLPADQPQQLLLNYVFGSPESNVLLLPVAPGVHFINHAPSSTKNTQRRAAATKTSTNLTSSTQSQIAANAYLRWWSNMPKQHSLNYNYFYHTLSAHDLLDEAAENAMWIEIVALRDLEAGEEIFIDYGSEWEKAWQKHEADFSYGAQADYVNAHQFRNQTCADKRSDVDTCWIRTVEEQIEKPYPENIATACAFAFTPKAEHAVKSGLPVEWEPFSQECMRFCDVLSLNEDGTYNVRIHPRLGENTELRIKTGCGKTETRLPPEGIVVNNVPIKAIDLANKPYSLDFQRPQAFRHYIGIPDTNFYPKLWNSKDARPDGDFIPTPLDPGQIEVIRWADTGHVVTPNAYRIGMPESVREVLLEYCQRMGVVDIFRHITMHGNSLDIGTDTYLDLDGEKWYLQRPDKRWNSNLQWLSPGDNSAHEHYLEALSVAGFDDVLKAIGERFQMNGLVAFHLTFMAVSQSTRGYLHFDVTRTQAKAFNVIIPLILANETGPELDLQSDWEEVLDKYTGRVEERVGRYRYEYHVASMMGDDALHASSAVDYRVQKEMRLAATVYVADVTEANVNEIMAQYTQAYPPNDRDLLLSWAGTHWKKDDPSISLPKPRKGHVLTEPHHPAIDG